MKRLLQQAIRFVGLSGIGWLLDFTTYSVLLLFTENLFLVNTVSSFVGVTFVFCNSTRLVFQNTSKIPLKLKYIVYLLYQCVLILLMSKLIGYINGFLAGNLAFALITTFSEVLSKIIITPVTMTLNFIVMKLIIEKL